jgi:putative ABC transport system ATP-binding protein
MSTYIHGVHFIDLRGVRKTFNAGFTALQETRLQIDQGQFVAVVGRSGSGKSTLLNLIAGIDRPTAGQISIGGTELQTLDESALARWRGRNVGVVFQSFQLLPTLTILENVLLPIELCRTLPASQARIRGLELLDQVGVVDQATKLPSTLSGGQQQRAAIARALANDPKLLVADEPTGNLDSQTAEAVISLLSSMSRAGLTVLMVTHERDLRRTADRVITLADGRITDPEEVSHVSA